MRKQIRLLLFFILFIFITGQSQSGTKIFTSDISNFWLAYDSVLTTKDSNLQKEIIQTLYLDKASEGLKEFIILRSHSASRHLKNILQFSKFWNSIKINTLQIEERRNEIENILINFKMLYPAFKQPEIYFTIGCLNSGGTTKANKVLIGSEIAAANKSTDASELTSWLQGVFKNQDGVINVVAHEIVHTQQASTKADNLLGNCIIEGSADFITEILIQKKVLAPYMIHGFANEEQLWRKFAKEMYGTDLKSWLYNGSQIANADLGYFMGYIICKSYYDNSKNKQKAIREILKLKVRERKKLELFFQKSMYADKWK